MKIEKEVIAEWKRYIESEEFQHNPECGTLLIAQHFYDYGKRQQNEKGGDTRAR